MLRKTVGGLSLLGMIAAFVILGIMCCMAFQKGASAESVQMYSATLEQDGVVCDVTVDAQREGEAQYKDVPFQVSIRNQGKDFKGYLCIFTGESQGKTVQYRKYIALAKDEHKDFTFTVTTSKYQGAVTIGFSDKEGKIGNTTSLAISDQKDTSVDAYEVDNGYYYDYDYLRDGVSTGETDLIPNIALYVLVLLVYIIFVGPVAYMLLRHRHKRQLLWVVVPVSAVICSILIYLLGTGTRIQNPYVTYLSQLTVGEGNTDVLLTTFSLTSPNNGDYQVEAKDNGSIAPGFGLYGEIYDVTKQQTDDKLIIEKGKDKTKILVKDSAAFDKNFFQNDQKVDADGQFTLTGVSATELGLTGTITNHLSYDVVDTIVALNGKICRIGTLKQGQSYDLSKIKQSDVWTMNGIDEWEEIINIMYTGDMDGYNVDNAAQMRRMMLLKYYGLTHLSTDENTGELIFDNSNVVYGFRADGEETAFTKMFELNKYGETAVAQPIKNTDVSTPN